MIVQERERSALIAGKEREIKLNLKIYERDGKRRTRNADGSADAYDGFSGCMDGKIKCAMQQKE